MRPKTAARSPTARNIQEMNTLDFVDQASLRDDIPAFGPGDTVNVHVKVIEGNKQHPGLRVWCCAGPAAGSGRPSRCLESYGVGVERTFLHSPNIDHLEVVTRGDVRRASC